MLQMIYALEPTLRYFIKGQAQALTKEGLSRSVRSEYLQAWSKETLQRMHVHPTVKGKVSKKTCIFVGNHVSYLDIPLLCYSAPAIFIAKKELSYWPLIGNAARLCGTVFVERSSKESRNRGAEAILTKLKKEKETIAVFPSGTTSVDENVPWRMGAFRIAYENGIPIQPFRIHYSDAKAAFIGKDYFLPHMLKLLKEKKIKASIEFDAPRLISNVTQDLERIRLWCMR